MTDKNGKEVIIGYPCIVDLKNGELVEQKLGQVISVNEGVLDTATVMVLDEKVGHIYEVLVTSAHLEMR